MVWEILFQIDENCLCRLRALHKTRKTLLEFQARLGGCGGPGEALLHVIGAESRSPPSCLSSERGGAERQGGHAPSAQTGMNRVSPECKKNVMKYWWACLNEADRGSGQSRESARFRTKNR